VTCFQNHARSENQDDHPDKRRGVRSYVRTYKLKDVVAHVFKGKVGNVIAGKTDDVSGSKDWLKHYPAALASVLNGLTDDEVKTCEEMLEKWNKEGLSEAQKQT
jgi:hypothetical protein